MHGEVDAAFAPVRDAFAECFAEHGERGGAVCVVVGGRVVVDLWGGTRDDAGTPWEPDTLVNVFSVGKALVATGAARLAGEQRLDLDEPIARRWPSFGAAGKDAVTMRQVLSHTAGLPAIRAPLGPEAVFDPERLRAALAAEEPFWTPGTEVGYHVNTFGLLAGAVIERIVGRSVGRYLREEVTGPLGAELLVGLSRSELGRVATFVWPSATSGDGLAAMGELQRLAYLNPPTFSGHGVVNTVAWRRCEHPSANAHASARGIARLYEALAAGGRLDGTTVVDRAALDEATQEWACGADVVLERPSRFGLGFQLTSKTRPLGVSPRAFGHFGAGGSLGFCDPDAGLAFGYVTSTMGPRWQNPKNRALTAAVEAAMASAG